MKRAYLQVLVWVSCSASALAAEPGVAGKYEIWCEGEITAPNEKPHSESFTWIVDEAAPPNEQIFHLGKSVCDNTVSCVVEIKPYQIHVQTVMERSESGRHFHLEFDGTINRITGSGQAEGLVQEVHGQPVSRHKFKATYACERHAFERAI